MKKIFLLLFCSSTFLCLGQIQKEVENGISVSFPNSPTYKTVQNASTFSSKTESSLTVSYTHLDVYKRQSVFFKNTKQTKSKYRFKIPISFGKINAFVLTLF